MMNQTNQATLNWLKDPQSEVRRVWLCVSPYVNLSPRPTAKDIFSPFSWFCSHEKIINIYFFNLGLEVCAGIEPRTLRSQCSKANYWSTILLLGLLLVMAIKMSTNDLNYNPLAISYISVTIYVKRPPVNKGEYEQENPAEFRKILKLKNRRN